ncbi:MULTISPECIES: SRPBCC domain-containing protein [unclassified Streptomyces]|uniref:SRPBCC domain-containing protein n=1 Tax=unclassified Streptomyces TaxID=2593676 RepID=UPI001E43157F|nr:SRPBCC domain-containing protein [Streptomyces sp. CB02980]MCB8907238.1 SRPBCC domain-containing protein [Streptomyces sp. CB02980]
MVTLLTTPADRELVITRTFDAPPARVWEAWTVPAHVREWYGVSGLTTTVVDIDLRVGGAWRWGQTAPEGQQIVFSGRYEDVVPVERLDYTEVFEQMPDGDPVRVTLTFDATPDGGTALTSTSFWPSNEIRDQSLAAGMEAGVREQYDRLAEHLKSM